MGFIFRPKFNVLDLVTANLMWLMYPVIGWWVVALAIVLTFLSAFMQALFTDPA